ncbi:MAG: hypothetical protein KAJ73_05535 [Zetaproteobacteria bacterium]|nr:hypothetical protein [Zetaproteobacteria bacterium]
MNSRQFAALFHIVLAIAYGVMGKKDMCRVTIERAEEWYKVWIAEIGPKD